MVISETFWKFNVVTENFENRSSYRLCIIFPIGANIFIVIILTIQFFRNCAELFRTISENDYSRIFDFIHQSLSRTMNNLCFWFNSSKLTLRISCWFFASFAKGNSIFSIFRQIKILTFLQAQSKMTKKISWINFDFQKFTNFPELPK